MNPIIEKLFEEIPPRRMNAFSNSCGYPKDWIYYLKRAKRPSLDQVQKIADKLGYDVRLIKRGE